MIVSGSTSPVSDTDTYRNTIFGFSFLYPSGWTITEKRISEPIPLVVEVVDSLKTHRLSVEVYKDADFVATVKDRIARHIPIDLESPKTDQIMIDGTSHEAYIYPDGFECNMGNPDQGDCSFFRAYVLQGNDIVYELYALGDAKTISSLYRQIFSTFKTGSVQ